MRDWLTAIVCSVALSCAAHQASAQPAVRSCGGRPNTVTIELTSGPTASGKPIGSFDCVMPWVTPTRGPLCAQNANNGPLLDFTFVLRNSCRATTPGNRIEVDVNLQFVAGDLPFESGDCGDGRSNTVIYTGRLGNAPVKKSCSANKLPYDPTRALTADYDFVVTRIVELSPTGAEVRAEAVNVSYDPQIAVERAGDGKTGKRPVP